MSVREFLNLNAIPFSHRQFTISLNLLFYYLPLLSHSFIIYLCMYVYLMLLHLFLTFFYFHFLEGFILGLLYVRVCVFCFCAVIRIFVFCAASQVFSSFFWDFSNNFFARFCFRFVVGYIISGVEYVLVCVCVCLSV